MIGITPEKISLSIAYGIILGIFPLNGVTTILCTIAAFAFKLNLPAIQIANFMVYPFQFLLLIPFFRAGEYLFAAESLPLSITQIKTMFAENIWGTLEIIWTTTWHAIIVWCLLAPGLIFLLSRVLQPIVRRLPVGVKD